MLQVGTITYLMITDNICILHLELSAYTAHSGYKGKIRGDAFSGIYTSYTAYPHKGTNRHIQKILPAANLCCVSQKSRVHLEISAYNAYRGNKGE